MIWEGYNGAPPFITFLWYTATEGTTTIQADEWPLG